MKCLLLAFKCQLVSEQIRRVQREPDQFQWSAKVTAMPTGQYKEQ